MQYKYDEQELPENAQFLHQIRTFLNELQEIKINQNYFPDLLEDDLKADYEKCKSLYKELVHAVTYEPLFAATSRAISLAQIFTLSVNEIRIKDIMVAPYLLVLNDECTFGDAYRRHSFLSKHKNSYTDCFSYYGFVVRSANGRKLYQITTGEIIEGIYTFGENAPISKIKGLKDAIVTTPNRCLSRYNDRKEEIIVCTDTGTRNAKIIGLVYPWMTPHKESDLDRRSPLFGTNLRVLSLEQTQIQEEIKAIESIGEEICKRIETRPQNKKETAKMYVSDNISPLTMDDLF